jgi:hypothetical protein
VWAFIHHKKVRRRTTAAKKDRMFSETATAQNLISAVPARGYRSPHCRLKPHLVREASAIPAVKAVIYKVFLFYEWRSFWAHWAANKIVLHFLST